MLKVEYHTNSVFLVKHFLTISLASRKVLVKLSARFGRDSPPSANAVKYKLQILKTMQVI